MVESKLHCVALTQYGFNVDERDDEQYRPISLESHVQLIGYALRKLRKMYPRKRVTLVGFSFGADMILLLGQFAPEVFRDAQVRRTLLLDPNVNRSTTTISARIAQVDDERPLPQLVKVLEDATDVAELRYLCEYLYKITSKNFPQVQQHAQDVVEVWNVESYATFLDYLGQLTNLVGDVRVVLSANSERVFNGIVRGASARGLDTEGLDCSRLDHFELIGPAFLKDWLEGTRGYARLSSRV